MEEVTIEHPFHEHPLILTENVDKKESVNCYGCENPVSNCEWAYVCIQEKYCSRKTIFHRRCGELTRQISHPSHPSHPLHLVDFRQRRWHYCNLCFHIFGMELGYRCSSCDFDLDITCKHLGADELFGTEPRQLQHPAHFHPLVLMRKPPFTFNCDACGTEDDRDMAYTCKSATCDLLIHKSCALLPRLLPTNHHHHQLSLASRFPFHHRNFVWQCAVCGGDFDMACWVYYCGDCRYFAHLRCATSAEKENNEKNDDGFDLIEFPLLVHDVSKKLITPFVIQETYVDKIPDVNDMPQSINMPKTKASYSFLLNHHHKHTLSLVSEVVSHDDHDDDDDEVKMKICDVCVAPISSPPYYECATCNYFVHSVCYLLPETISAFQSQQYGECPKTNASHKLTHYTSSKRLMDKGYSHLECEVCGSYTNGMVYKCEECGVTIDAKCASLPNAIKHASHHGPHHVLIKRRVLEKGSGKPIKCFCCEHYCTNTAFGCTNDVVFCDFALCPECVLLPQSIMKKEWDKHPLRLTYDASIDHPSDFYCGICEQEMHPKEWMYHCRPCDNSFHIYCLRSAFEWYRNIKFGRQFEFDGRIHPHPLTFTRITLKLKCDVCHSNEYLDEGFKCASCDHYVVCRRCGYFELEKKYRNIKFGRQFELDRLHSHPLTFNQITIKLRCDVCHDDKHLYEGFECASCNFVVCLSCGRRELDKE